MILWFDEVCTSQTKIDEDVNFLNSVFRKHKIRKVLDVCCATGRHAIELAKKGYKIAGVDISNSAINIARKRAANFNFDIKFYRQDMKMLRIKEKYDAVMVMGALQYLKTNNECVAALSSINKLMKHGGILIISIQPLWSDLIKGKLKKRFTAIYRNNNRKLVISGRREFTPRHNWAIAFSEYHRFENNKHLPVIKEKVNIWRIFFPEELDLLFKLTGFKILDFYGDNKINAKLSVKNSKRFIVVAQKIK